MILIFNWRKRPVCPETRGWRLVQKDYADLYGTSQGIWESTHSGRVAGRGDSLWTQSHCPSHARSASVRPPPSGPSWNDTQRPGGSFTGCSQCAQSRVHGSESQREVGSGCDGHSHPSGAAVPGSGARLILPSGGGLGDGSNEGCRIGRANLADGIGAPPPARGSLASLRSRIRVYQRVLPSGVEESRNSN